MTKSQLQPGMLVITRAGYEYLVLPGKLFGLITTGILLSSYEEDLTVSNSNSFDIVQVYVTTANSVSIIHTPELRKLIWQREEHQYPIYCQHIPLTSIGQTLIVEFTGLQEGTIVHSDQAGFIGVFVDDWQPHTDATNWKQVSNPQPVVEAPTVVVEYEYPLFCKRQAGLLGFEAIYVVKFTSLQEGTIVESNMPNLLPVGYTCDDWTPHTDAMWEYIEPPKASESTSLSLEDICKMLGVTIKEVR